MKSCLTGMLAGLLFVPVFASAQTVRFHTSQGDIDVLLLPESAPKTVTNFLNYVSAKRYDNTFIHRLVANFVVQGGGYQLQNGNFVSIASNSPVQNEFKVSNTRGTIAMAKLAGDPNSATNQWFFNLKDNNTGDNNLDTQNGGFTVFGRIANDAGLAVLDKIAAVTVPSPPFFSSPFDQLPLIGYTSGSTVQASNLIVINSIEQLYADDAPKISENGVITASNFGGAQSATAGSFIEIYGANLARDARGWQGGDFTDGKAPTSLDGVSVSVNGAPSYVSFISPTQLNIQIPAGVPTFGRITLVVNNNGVTSPPVTLQVKPYEGGLLAPASFKVGDAQFAAAFHADGTFVSDGSIPGVAPSPAMPGETIVFYGVGFGRVAPSTVPIAGQVITEATSLTTPISFKIGGIPAQVQFAGLTQGLIGLYQFNVTLAADTPPGGQQIEMMVNGAPITQSLWVAVGAR